MDLQIADVYILKEEEGKLDQQKPGLLVGLGLLEMNVYLKSLLKLFILILGSNVKNIGVIH